MIPFKTTPEQVLTLASILLKMQQAGISATFIQDAHELACTDQGVFELMEIWSELPDGDSECDEAIADIQDVIDDHRDMPVGPVEGPQVRLDQIDRVVESVVAGKGRLQAIIDRHGGLSAVTKRAGVPQPSLSRMLSSGSMPRRSTLYKIAIALDLSEADVGQEWAR